MWGLILCRRRSDLTMPKACSVPPRFVLRIRPRLFFSGRLRGAAAAESDPDASPWLAAAAVPAAPLAGRIVVASAPVAVVVEAMRASSRAEETSARSAGGTRESRNESGIVSSGALKGRERVGKEKCCLKDHPPDRSS